MRCKIRRSFPFSTDGINSRQAVAGETRDIPDGLVPGLEAEGYVEAAEAKDAGASPEDKNAGASPENKMETEAETKPTRRKGRKAK